MNDIDVWTIIRRNTVFPKEVIESVTPILGELQKSGKIKGKMLDTVSIAIYIYIRFTICSDASKYERRGGYGGAACWH